MKIEEAFTQDAIQALGVDVIGDQEEEVREMIRRVYEANQIDVQPDPVINIAVLCFVAGRAYQADDVKINLSVSPAVVADFLEFQSRRESND